MGWLQGSVPSCPHASSNFWWMWKVTPLDFIGQLNPWNQHEPQISLNPQTFLLQIYPNIQNISNNSQTIPLTNIYRLIWSTYIGLNLWNPACADCCNPNHKRSAVALVVSSARLKGFGAAATAANWVQQTQSNTQAPLRHPAFAIRDQKIQSQNRGT